MAIDPGQYDPAIDKAIASRPEVVQSTTYVGFNTGPMVDDRPDFNQNFEALGTFDGRFFTMDRFAPTQGRLPNVDRDNEIAVNEAAADLYGYRIGQHLDLGTYSDEQLNGDFSFDDPPPPRSARTRPSLASDCSSTKSSRTTPTVSRSCCSHRPSPRRPAPTPTYAWQGLTLRRGDADVPAVKDWYVSQLDPGSPQFFRVTSVDTFHAQQAVRPLSLALAFFGGIAFVATLVLVSQAVNRRLRRGRADQSVLFSIGASTRALALASFIGPVLAVGLGALVAVGLAYALSPLMPIGVVRRVEVARGLDADWTVIGLGVPIFVVVLALVAAITVFKGLPHRRGGRDVRATDRASSPRRPGRASRRRRSPGFDARSSRGTERRQCRSAR